MVKYYIWVCLCGCLWKRSVSELGDWVKMPSPVRVDIIQPTEGPNRTKSGRKGDSALWLSWDIHLLPPLDISASSFPTFGLGLELVSPAPWFSGLGTQHSWFSACRQQTMGFLKPPSSHASFPSPFGVIFQYPILMYQLCFWLSFYTF